jgi:hypothetical protein
MMFKLGTEVSLRRRLYLTMGHIGVHACRSGDNYPQGDPHSLWHRSGIYVLLYLQYLIDLYTCRRSFLADICFPINGSSPAAVDLRIHQFVPVSKSSLPKGKGSRTEIIN